MDIPASEDRPDIDFGVEISGSDRIVQLVVNGNMRGLWLAFLMEVSDYE